MHFSDCKKDSNLYSPTQLCSINKLVIDIWHIPQYVSIYCRFDFCCQDETVSSNRGKWETWETSEGKAFQSDWNQTTAISVIRQPRSFHTFRLIKESISFNFNNENNKGVRGFRNLIHIVWHLYIYWALYHSRGDWKWQREAHEGVTKSTCT